MRRTAVGDATGVVMPASVADLREAPEAFLTRAMHAYGTLAPDNRVASVDRLEVFSGGNPDKRRCSTSLTRRQTPTCRASSSPSSRAISRIPSATAAAPRSAAKSALPRYLACLPFR